jgi:hypothetical protein
VLDSAVRDHGTSPEEWVGWSGQDACAFAIDQSLLGKPERPEA